MAVLYSWRAIAMDDGSNAEAGIATSHTKAAQNELGHAKGFERQHDWSINHLDERIFGNHRIA